MAEFRPVDIKNICMTLENRLTELTELETSVILSILSSQFRRNPQKKIIKELRLKVTPLPPTTRYLIKQGYP